MKRRLEEFEEKYCDLVWFARRTEEDEKIENIGIQIEEIRSKYPKETQDLEDDDEGDWHHGFNSGMLAAVRHLKNPKKDFPSLCTY